MNESQKDYGWLIACLLMVVVVAISCIGIFQSNIGPIFDQKFISYQFNRGYPKISDGISSFLIVGFINFVKPYDPIQTNNIVRALATATYLIAGGLLSWKVLSDIKMRWLFFPFLVIFLTSRYPFLWLSTELFAGSFIFLAIWGALNSFSYFYVSLLLALFCFSKPELILPGLLIGGYFSVVYGVGRREKVIRGLALFGFVSMFILPGIFQKGLQYLNPGNRLLASFGQHYGLVVYLHQLGVPLNPWFEWKTYLEAGFGEVDTIWMAIKSFPYKYMDFIFLTIALSIRKMIVSNLLFFLPWLGQGTFIRKIQFNRIVAILFSANLLPVVLFSTLHVRYQARFYPLFLLSGFTTLSQAKGKGERLLFTLFLCILFLLQIYQSIPVIMNFYWFPD